MGRFPEESVAMLARIAASTEAHRDEARKKSTTPWEGPAITARQTDPDEAMADVVRYSIQHTPASAVFVPTRTGATARMISRFKPRVWIVALSPDPAVCQGLAFSYGVLPLHAEQEPDHWRDFTAAWLTEHGLPVRLAVLVAGPSPQNPEANLRIEFLHMWNQGK